MKVFYLFLGAVFMAPLTSYAQSITVLDSANKLPVPGATVMALNQSTGKIEKQGATDVNGFFASVIPGDAIFYLSVSATGYKKAIVKQNLISQTILMTRYNNQLKVVNISSAKSPVKFNGNIIEYDISQWHLMPTI